ncbi:MAG TPA: RluA family pseudouridine synthase [Gemmatimonadales bacterium]|nr:RluA family pseudouridine synthase [Gemmatimonadales bacterium]
MPPHRFPPDDAAGAVTFSIVPPSTERLDRFLADQLQLSRTHSARLVAAKVVTVNGTVARASRTLERGDVLVVTLPEHEPPRQLAPNPIDLDLVYEDDDIAVIDKPAGLVVHPAPGHWDDTLVNALVARGTTLAGGADGRPGIVHRLDRETSGLMLVAKTDLAHRRLGAMIAGRRVTRVYAALAWGHLDEPKVVIDAPIGRNLKDRKRMAILEAGRAARTDAFGIARLGPVELVRLELHSGRTHQIRVHLESIGHPVVGDPVYAGGGARRITGKGRAEARALEALAPRQALHAALLAFRHPVSGTPLRLASPWPADLWPLLELAAGPGVLADRGSALTDLGFFGADG